MNMQISFERQILEGLGNTDMLSAYVRAAVADRGDGVRVNGALWPHLTPPAKVGGVARALVKMGLLVPSGAGVYQVVTGKANLERQASDEPAKCQRRASEAPAVATESLQGGGSDVSEGQAEQGRQASEDGATEQQRASDDDAGGDIEALENLLDTMSTRETIVNPEERARELARQSWEGMPDPVKARVGHDFEEFWKTSAGRFRRDAAS